MKTKVQMKAEIYVNSGMISNSVVTELTDEFDATDDFFMPPMDKELIDGSDALYE